MRGPQGDKGQNKAQTAEAYERLASGHRRDDVAKPKSLKAAEQAKLQNKLQDERRQRERQEREERAKQTAAAAAAASAANASASTPATAASASTKARNNLQGSPGRSALQAGDGTGNNAAGSAGVGSAAPAGGNGKRAHRRSATMDTPVAQLPPSASAPALVTSQAAAAAPTYAIRLEEAPVPRGSPAKPGSGSALLSQGGAKKEKDAVRPPVPVFKQPEPWVALRAIELPAKRLDDNYEISEPNDSDNEEAEELKAQKRTQKHIPGWCENYLDVLQHQTNIDPDTIFTSRVPQCVLEDIFTDEMYSKVRKDRPIRRRGSSGDWHKDRLTRTEVSSYKSRMGQTKGWSDMELPASSSAVLTSGSGGATGSGSGRGA